MTNPRGILCILDGWGVGTDYQGNAIYLAKPQTFNHLFQNSPHALLKASGPAVGLPDSQDGNSETGHLNIGAGRIVYQDLSVINMSIVDGSFFTKKALLDTVRHLSSYSSNLHLLGMIGNSGVHSSNEHLYALLMFAKNQNIKNVFVHVITDGRDSPPDNAYEQIGILQEKIKEIGVGQIVSVMGRYFAMDRDLRLERTAKAFDCLTKLGKVEKEPLGYINSSYQQGTTDEFLEPMSFSENPETRIGSSDAVIFFNFRTDRPRQLSEMFFKSAIPNLRFVTMTKYRKDFTNPCLFESSKVTQTLGEVIASKGFKQLRMAETEKIAMVSYYFNGQDENAFEGEERFFVDSPKVATYDLSPGMSTEKLIKEFSEHFSENDYKLGVLNIACPDMVAHTGKIDKTIEAIRIADEALLELVNLAKKTQSYLFITADHGNAEELTNTASGKIDTEHSTSPVPFIVYHPQDTSFKLSDGKLGDVAPTILHLLNIEKPIEMSGNNLAIPIAR